MKIKYFYLNENVELCVIIGELPASKQEQEKLKDHAIPIKNQKRAWEIMNQQYKSTTHSTFYKINYPAVYSAMSNQILN